MSVYYKFKSAKDYDKVDIEGHFISAGALKEKIFELKRLHMGTDYDLVITNAQTNEEYHDDGMQIAKNTSVLIRRVPGRPRKPIITAPATQQEESIMDNNSADRFQALKDGSGAEPSAMKNEDLDWDEFGNDLYAIPEPVSFTSSIPVQDAPPVSKEDEDNMIKALIDTSALDWQRQPSDGYATSGRGFARMNGGGRMNGGRGFGRGGFEKKTPPEGYICHRCKVPGHFIQHCPTNGDPTFDIKRFKPPTGIPKSMLMPTTDGSYALPSGGSGVLKPNEAAFEKEIEGMPSTRSVGELPPELHCPLCKDVMKDAVLTSKCCFTSFCDKCIRDHIISKSMCVCGATNVLADDLLPNKTLRVTINRNLESNNNNSSDDNGGRTFLVPDMESRNPQAKPPSPTESAASKGQQMLAPRPQGEETSKIPEPVVEEKVGVAQLQENVRTAKLPDVSEATHESRGMKEAISQGSAQLPLAEEEVQQKPLSGDAGKKKKKKKIRVNPGDPEMQWRGAQDLGPENYMMPMAPSGFNPYWNGMQPGFDGFMPPYPGPMPYMGYGPSPMDVAYPFPPDPFGGMNCMMPYGPPPVQRDLSELARAFNTGPPAMSREQFEARKADLKRKRDMERNRERDLSKDRDYGREVSSAVDVSPVKSKSKSASHQPPSDEHHHQQPPSRHRAERRSSPDRRSRDLELPRPSSKKKSDHDQDYSHHEDVRHHRSREHHGEEHRQRGRSSSQGRPDSQPDAAGDKNKKRSVFSRISFPEKEPAPKKVKTSSASESVAKGGSSDHRAAASVSNGYHEEHRAVTGSKKSSVSTAVDQDSSDDERHFKRRPSRYTSSPPPPVEEEPRHSRGSRGRERDRERGGYNKYR